MSMKVYNTREAAAELGVTENAIYVAVSRGMLHVERVKATNGPNRYQITADELERYRAARLATKHRARALTDEQAAEIYRRYHDGGVTQAELAAEFGVSQNTISNVVNRRHAYADVVV